MDVVDFQPEKKIIERQTAVKVWISNLINGQYMIKPGWEPNQVISGDLHIGRANIIGVVVQKSNSKVINYDSLVLDDSTGRIVVRAFENPEILKPFTVGEIVNIIGKPREYGNEIYLIPEIAKRVEEVLWIEVRKRELQQLPIITTKEQNKEPLQQNTSVTQEEQIEDETIVTPRDKLLTAIRELDHGEGVEIETILSTLANNQSEKLLQTMLLRGDIFEIKPGKVKILE